MARGDGVSARTKKGLVDTGAMTPEELAMTKVPVKPVKPAPVAAPPTRGIGKQLSNQSEYDKKSKEDRAKADANRQRVMDERSKQRLRGY